MNPGWRCKTLTGDKFYNRNSIDHAIVLTISSLIPSAFAICILSLRQNP